MRFSSTEIRELIKAWIAISLAFTIADYGIGFGAGFILVFLMSAATAGLGFVLHEISHKFVAQRNGCLAEFRANNSMLILSIMLSFTGFLFAAPGAVIIIGHVSRKAHGKIAAAGCAANLGLAILFLAVHLFSGSWIAMVALVGFSINTWLALFNLLPFGQFDGLKIFGWNKVVYASMAIISMGLMIVLSLL